MNSLTKLCIKWGLIGMGIYILCVGLNLLGWTVGGPFIDKHPDLLPPGSLSFFIPLMVLSFYPGLLIAGNYENIAVIIPINLIFYFALGALIGWIKYRR